MSASEAIVALRRTIPKRVDDAVMLLDETGLQKLAMLGADLDVFLGEGRSLAAKPLEGDQAEARAVELALQAKAALSEVDALRRKYTDPLNDQVKEINALFRDVMDPIRQVYGDPVAKVKGLVEPAVLLYRREKAARIAREQEEGRKRAEKAAQQEAEARARAEQAKTQKAREKATAEADAAAREVVVAEYNMPAPMTRGVRTDSGTGSVRTRFVLQGIFDLDKVPQSYWRHEKVVAALKGVIQAAVTSGVREIPGCSIGPEEALTRRIS